MPMQRYKSAAEGIWRLEGGAGQRAEGVGEGKLRWPRGLPGLRFEGTVHE